MAVKTPVRGEFNGSGDLTGLSEFQASDFIGITDGGTGATTASGARSNLGLVIGTNIQAFNARLTDVSGLAVTDGGFIVGDGSNFVLETGNTARASLGLATSDSPTFNGLTLNGNLIVNGSTTTINSTTTTVDDPIFTLGGDTAPSSDDNKDRGIEFRYYSSGSAKLGFFGFDDSSGKFTFIPDATNTSEVFSGTAGTIVANIEGNVTGTVSSIANFDTDNLSEGSSNLYFTNERVDDRVNALLVDSATSGIDITYDDASNQLTITTDLGEITSDLNERVDDRVDSLLTAGSNVSLTYDDVAGTLTIASTDTNTQLTTEQVQDIVGGMVDGGTETNVTVTYDDTNGRLNFVVDQLTSEQVQDIIGPMFSSNTETFIDVAYDDSDGTLDLVVPVKDEDNMASNSDTHLATQQSIKAYVDSQVQTEESIEDFVGGMITGNTETLITVSYDDSDGTMDFVVDNDLANYDNTNSGFITATLTNEQVQDIVGAMFTSNTETNISATYQDSDGTIDLVSTDTQLTTEEVQDIVGAMFSSNTETNVTATYQDSDGTIDLSTTAQLSTEEVQDIVGAMFSSNTETNIAVTYDDSDGTIDLVSTDTQLTAEQVQDIVGAMFSSNTETNITATYEDSDGTIDLVADLLTEEAVEDFVAGLIVGGTNVTATYDDAAGTLTLDATDTNTQLTQEQVEDFVGGMLDGTETFITVDYDDTNGNIDFVVPVKDEDNMASDSASHLATQQSIKAYVDSQITAEDLDFQADSGGALAIDLDSETLTFTGGTGIDTSGSGNTVTFAIDSTVVTESSTDTLTNKTISFEDNTAIIEFVVTVANPGSGNKFYLDGELAANVQLIPGITYRFNQSDNSNSGHPLRLSTTKNGTHGGGSAYTTGVTINGSAGNSGGYTQIVVNAATADKLYYYCSSHSGMGNDSVISVQGSSFVAGTGISISGETISTTITQYADSDVQSYLSGGTGVTLSGSGEFSIGQAVATSSNVTFADIAATGNVTITGNLDVNGTTTTIDTTNTTVTDSIIELGNGTSGSPSNDAGIVIERGSADNAFIGFDESADKFVVGTGSFTGASSGNLTISTGTLLANVEGNLTGTASNATTAAGIAATAVTGLTAETSQNNADLVIIYDDSASALRKMTVGNLLSNAGAFNSWTLQGDAGSNQTVNDGNTVDIAGGTGITTTAGATDTLTVAVDSTVITAQATYSGTVQTSSDFVLIYDDSTTALKKIAVSDLIASVPSGTMTSFDISGDTGSNQTIADSNVLTFTGGSGIDTSIGGTDTVTIALNTEAVQDIVGAMFTSNTETNISATYEDSDGTIDLVSTDTQLTTEEVQDIVGAMFSSNTETNITATYQDSDGTIDLVAGGGTVTEAFKNIAVAGQTNVVADGATDTLTLVGGTGMTITTTAGTDTITFASSGGGGGTMPFTGFDGSTDNIVLSSASTGGALPVTLAGGSSDPINMTATTQTLTSYADDDGDTKVEVERTTDNDTVHIKAGGTDVITATSSGVTITNLTVSGTTTQANELKITDTLFELNADGGSLTTDAGMIIERGSTGDNAAFIWDESTDSFVAGTTATDGSASSNLTVTEADLKAKTQNQSDNSTKVATTAYVDTALGSLSSNSITDADSDTKIQVEESSDEDIIRADTGGQERVTIDNNVSMSARGGFFTHNLTMHTSETFTIASTEGTVAAGPLDVQGTVDVQGSLVIL